MTTRRYPDCIFHEPYVRDKVDPRLKVAWEKAFRKPPPFGDLRLQWKKHHCATINPYGGECPFTKTECTQALVTSLELTFRAQPNVPVGYFIRVAKNLAARRADEAQNRRVAKRRAEAATEESGHIRVALAHPPARLDGGPTGYGPTGLAPDRDREAESLVHRVGPGSLADVFGSLHIGPRDIRFDKGKEGPKR